jgi:hypothetical protein
MKRQKESEMRDTTHDGKVTQIINQNNINNFIIQNPERVELVEYAPAQALPVPGLKTRTLVSIQGADLPPPPAPPPEAIVKKLAPAKKVPTIMNMTS